MKRKIGDKVRIKSLGWYEANKNEDGDVKWFRASMIDFLGLEAKVTEIYDDRYELDIDKGSYYWGDEMLEDYVEFVKYEHHGTEVSVRENLKGLHRDHCLCHSCSKFIDSSDKCKIAEATYKNCVEFGITTQFL